MAYTYQDYEDDDGTQALAQPSNDQIPVHAAECSQLLLQDNFRQPPNTYVQSLNQTFQAYQHHSLAATLSSQRQSPALGTSHAEFASAYPEMHQMYAPSSIFNTHFPAGTTLHNQHDLMYSHMSTNSASSPSTHPSSSHTSNSAHYLNQHHNNHHHHLPRRHTISDTDRTCHDSGLCSAKEYFPSSVVGYPDMPKPAARPAGPKLKFTPKDDTLLVELKETKDLTWKQIADFFPGRSSGTLQVRYCTKLKMKQALWTETLLERLCQALEEYERDRWRIVSQKVGNGFSATACKDKADELNEGRVERRDFAIEEIGHLQS